MEQVKTCYKCKEIKNIILFIRDRSECKKCANQRVSKWKKENPDKVRASSANYYQNNKDKSNAYSKLWAINNPEKIMAYAKKGRVKNRERNLEYGRNYRLNKKEELTERNKFQYKRRREFNIARAAVYFKGFKTKDNIELINIKNIQLKITRELRKQNKCQKQPA